MNRLIPIDGTDDIPPSVRGTGIARLLEYHDLGRPFETHQQAELLVGMCMDYRKHLRIPDNFAYIVRAGGANLRYSEFKVSYAIAIGGVTSIALIGHSQCGMVDIESRRRQFIDGLVERAGWQREAAEEQCRQFAPTFEIGNEVDFVRSEAKRLRLRYPKIAVAPLLFRVEDNRIYALRED